MREILFRGKRTDNGEWIDGYYADVAKNNMILTGRIDITETVGAEVFRIIPETVGQFTGIYDKNGRKIFEGDIIEITDTFNKIISGVVYWCDCAFWADCSHPDGDDGFYSLGHLGDCAEVIGNIYDNPELLENNTGKENSI